MTTTMTQIPAAQLASAMTTPLSGAAFDAAYGGGDWTMDAKLDGHRMIVVIGADHQVSGWSNGRGATPNQKSLPAHLVTALAQLPPGIYDGELVVPGGHSWDVVDLSRQAELVYVAFDILELFGDRVTFFAQADRRALLTQAVAHVHGDRVQLVASYAPRWANVESIWANGGEGAILKRTNAPYRPGARVDSWVKVKQLIQLVGTVTGFDTGSYGPYAVTVLRLDNGIEARVKTKDHATITAITNDPPSFIGRRLVIEAQMVTKDGRPRHPMMKDFIWDHEAGEAE